LLTEEQFRVTVQAIGYALHGAAWTARELHEEIEDLVARYKEALSR
jgi:hypothetical protein